MTVEVALDLSWLGCGPARVEPQAAFLLGTGSTSWSTRAARVGRAGGASAISPLRARSRIREAEALTDPAGLGALTVATWLVTP